MFELSLEEETEICLKTNLTPTELFIIRLLFLSKNGNTEALANYLNNSGVNLRDILISLKDKKIILSSYKIPEKGENLDLDIPFSKVFLKNYIKDSHELGKEFYDKYPMFIEIGGKKCSIRNITKGNFYTLDDFFDFYAKTIKSYGILHEKVLELLDYGVEHNLINYSILEFVASHKWCEIEYIRDSGEVNGYSNSDLL